MRTPETVFLVWTTAEKIVLSNPEFCYAGETDAESVIYVTKSLRTLTSETETIKVTFAFFCQNYRRD